MTKKYGVHKNPLYKAYASMRGRVCNENDPQYKDYGGRGIRICSRWTEPDGVGFQNFLDDMGPRPDGFTLDRIDNDGNYEPGNCRWATRAEQVRNRRNNIQVTLDGRTMVLKDWCAELGVGYNTVRRRVRAGQDPIEALNAPIRKYLKRS